ncbi:MAG: fatty acid desaturase [Gemmatimonadota bacterium]|nr:MAG: fatty acid desaturase [Gemmatimonadota bacterium]
MTARTAAETSIDWNALLAPYRKPELWRSVYQLVNTAVPFAAVWLLMLWSLDVGYWLTLLLAVPAALLVVRMFMFQHDCGHGAFFRSQRANNLVGSVIGVLTLVPYAYWRKTHAMHHATSGNLDLRGFGDIDTLTVREYLSRSWIKRLLYRLYRNGLVMLLVGPAFQFIIKHRYPADIPRSWKREWASVHWTNVGLLAVLAVAWLTVGLDRFLLVQLPIVLLSGSIGVFLFYVQHQYEDTYWRYREAWNYYAAGLEGASHLLVPKVLQWFTANIGLHHIHHVSSRIPNYHLQRCYDENPELHDVTKLTLGTSVKTLWLTLWDEEEGRLVGFRDLPAIRRRLEQGGTEGAAVGPTKPEAVPRSWR